MLKTGQQEKLYLPTDVSVSQQCRPQLLSVKFENLVHSIFRNENLTLEINVSHFGVLHWQQWQPPASPPEHLNFRISGQYIPRTTQVKYLGLTMNEHLDWDLYFSQLKNKPNRGIGLLSKIRHFSPKHLLKTLYFSLFNSNLIYGCQIWGQDQSEEFKKIEKLQEKAISIINFLPLNAPVEKQIYEMNILKLKDFIMLQSILFVKDCLSENAPGSFNDKFHPSKVPLNHTTRSSSKYQLKVNN